MKRKRYDDEFRASAVLMLEAAGYPNREGALLYTANHLGVARSTLRSWFDGTHNPPPAELRHKKGLDLLEAIQSELTEIFPALAGRREDASYRELVTAAGILIDKLQLLTGKPTERQEVHVTDHREKILAGIARKAEQLEAGDASDIYPQPVA